MQKNDINSSYLLEFEKNCFNDQEKALTIEAEVREFSKNLRSLEQFIQTVKGRNNYNSNWKKIGFR